MHVRRLLACELNKETTSPQRKLASVVLFGSLNYWISILKSDANLFKAGWRMTEPIRRELLNSSGRSADVAMWSVWSGTGRHFLIKRLSLSSAMVGPFHTNWEHRTFANWLDWQ